MSGMPLTNTTAAFCPQPAQALETVSTAGAVLQFTLAGLRQHTFGDY